MSLTISPERIVEESGSPLLAAPDSWPRRQLGTVATILNGFAFKSKLFVADGGKPLIRIRDISDDRTTVGYSGDYEDKYLVQPDELLVGMDGDFNCARWRGPEGLLNQRVCKITPDTDQLDLDYLTHLLPGYLQAIHDLTSSTTVTHLSSRDIAQIPIPVPRLDEQKALAEVVDGATSKQASATNHLTAARRAIERFRHSVLAAACSGQLTSEWRERNGHGRRLMPSPEPAELVDLPGTWAWASLGEITEVRLGGTPSRTSPTYWNGGIPWVSSGEVANRRISGTRETISETGLNNSNAKLYPVGTVLIAMIGEGKTRGQSAILDIEAATNQNVAGVLPKKSIIGAEYLWRWALAQYEVTRAAGRGGNQPALNGQRIRELVVAVPPLEEQDEIVRRADQLLGLADSIRSRVETTARYVEQSSEAVLAKALRGELTGQYRGSRSERGG